MINIQSYYAHIGYLTQDPSVFDGTILENLTYGISESVAKQFLLSPLEKNKQIKHILSSAKCDFVWALEK